MMMGNSLANRWFGVRASDKRWEPSGLAPAGGFALTQLGCSAAAVPVVPGSRAATCQEINPSTLEEEQQAVGAAPMAIRLPLNRCR